MRAASPGLTAYLAQARNGDAILLAVDCFTITLVTGQAINLTNYDQPVVFNGTTFVARSVLIDGLKYKTATGLEVDKQQLTFAAYPSQGISGSSFLQSVAGGALDGAHVQRWRVFLDRSLPNGADGVLVFQGRVSTVDSVGRTQAKITVASDLAVLEYDMPHNLFGPTCSHVLYDQGCGVSRSSFAFVGAVGAGSTQSLINWTGAQAGMAQGALAMSSGLNAGIQTTMKTINAGVAIGLLYPLPYPVAVGDTFNAYFGCDHTISTCKAKFNNVIHFRGFPFVPPVELTI